jgi:hypothetical protein
MTDEAGFYKKVSACSVVGGPNFPGWALNAQYHQLFTVEDGSNPMYPPWPMRGWSWCADGIHGKGYYHTNGTYKSGILPAVANYPCILLSADDKTPAYGWAWFATAKEAWEANNLVYPVPLWSHTIGANYICTCARERPFNEW